VVEAEPQSTPTSPELELTEGRLAVARALEHGLLTVPPRARDALVGDLLQAAAAELAARLRSGVRAEDVDLEAARGLLERVTNAEGPAVGRQELFELEQLVVKLQRRRQVRIPRVLRLSGRRLALVVAVLLSIVLGYWLWFPRNLLAGAPFRTSSSWAVCEPEKRRCGGAYLEVFFHTNVENEPWIEFDLGSTRKLGRVYVRNRHNYRERAVPLIVEVSRDRKSWREVRRQAEVFREWKAEFRPVQARFVRLRVAKHSTALHLEAVEIYER
jgi:hypothetical protein